MALKQLDVGASFQAAYAIEQLSDFIEFLQTNCRQEDALFRGQAADWSLRPKLGRLRKPAQGSLLQIEARMLDHFERAVAGYMPIPPTSKLELYALAQHHGMPTRLLDWTLNPLAALWFALDGRTAPVQPFAIVWMFTPVESDVIGLETNLETLRSVGYWKPRHISARIKNQESVFTIHPFLQETGAFQSLQESEEHKPELTKILVPRSVFGKTRFQLDRCGINAATIYPELDGLARHIEWLYSSGLEEGSHDNAHSIKRGYTLEVAAPEPEEAG